MIIFLISICFFVQPLAAQEKTKEEKAKELELQQKIDQQKKEMTEQKKALDFQSQEVEKAMQDAMENVKKNSDEINFSRSRLRNAGNVMEGLNQPYIVSPGVDMQGYARFFGHEGDAERTTWDFSKQVKETTFSRQYSFDVEKSVSTVVMTVMGDCKTGAIRVKILMPGGKTYSDIVIDEFGNLNWRKSFTISEEENQDKAGEWIFKIEAEKATGFFKISLQTY
jgi:ATP-dependent 26S proteasome regulatory subunit